MSASTLETNVSSRASSALGHEPTDLPHMALILVAPAWATEDCQPFVRRANEQGCSIYTVQTPDRGDLSITASLWEILDDIDAAVSSAALEHPEMPLVLIGHSDESSAAAVAV